MLFSLARMPWNVEGTVRLLLEKRSNWFEITERVLAAAAENEYGGGDVMDLLFKARGEKDHHFR